MSQGRHYQEEKINKQIKTHKTDAACVLFSLLWM